MYHESVDYAKLAEKATNLLIEATEGNERIGNLFHTDLGKKLIMESIYKAAELATKRVKNLRKSQEFAVWFSNEYENRTGQRSPDKITNIVREICVNVLTPYKKLFFSGD